MPAGWLRHQRRSHTLWQVAVYVLAVVAGFIALRRLAPVLAPVVAALAIAYLVAPLVDRLHRRRIPRAAAAAIVLVGFVLLLAAGVALLVPLIVDDIGRFLPEIPELAERAVRWIERTFGVSLPDDWRQAVTAAGDQLRRVAASATGPFVRSLALALGGVFSFLAGLLYLLVIPVFAFYFLVDWPKILEIARNVVPPRRREVVLDVAREIDGVLSSWVRGQLVVVAAQAILYVTALSLLGVQLAVPIGILAGVLSFIPYVGTGVGLVLALLMAVLDWQGVGRVVGVALVFAGVQALEGMVLTPRLVGKRVGLGEAGALFAVVAGAELLGFIGMMLAVPIAAALAVVVRRLYRHYLQTDFYHQGEAPGGEGGDEGGGTIAGTG